MFLKQNNGVGGGLYWHISLHYAVPPTCLPAAGS